MPINDIELTNVQGQYGVSVSRLDAIAVRLRMTVLEYPFESKVLWLVMHLVGVSNVAEFDTIRITCHSRYGCDYGACSTSRSITYAPKFSPNVYTIVRL